MTLSGKLEADVEIKASAELHHEIFSCRPHHVNTMSPDKIQGVDLHDGEWGKHGTIICWNYTHDGETKIAKELVEHIDDKNFSTSFKVIEGDLLKDYNSFRLIVKATPKEGGGCVVHWTLEYEKKHEGIPDPHSMLDFCVHTSKDICAHHTKPQPQPQPQPQK